MPEMRKTHSGGDESGTQSTPETTITEYVICEKQSLVELANKVREMGGASGSLNLGQLVEGANVNATDVAREAQLIEQIQSVLRGKGRAGSGVEFATITMTACDHSTLPFYLNENMKMIQFKSASETVKAYGGLIFYHTSAGSMAVKTTSGSFTDCGNFFVNYACAALTDGSVFNIYYTGYHAGGSN